jgi:hypothetical protein
MHRIQGYKIFEQINKQTDLFQSRVFSSEWKALFSPEHWGRTVGTHTS